MVMTDTATIDMRTNIGGTNGSGGTGTIIVTITIEITTGIEALFSLGYKLTSCAVGK